MRSFYLILSALVVVAAGCTEFAFVLRPPPQCIGVDVWTNVPEGQENVRARIGEVLHLPLGPSTHLDGLPTLYGVSINDVAVDKPECLSSSKTTTYIFRCFKPGDFHVEGRDLTTGRQHVWNISVSE
jgi:hypothetical protein